MKSVEDIRRETEQNTTSKIASFQTAIEASGSRTAGSALIRFIDELRRRRVCRAATMYAVAMWLISQVVELISGPLELPEWTLRLVIVLGLVGFPIALILSWMVDITPNGVVRDTGAPVTRTRGEAIVDSCLLTVALAIGAYLAISTIVEPPQTMRVAVLPFEVAAGEDADAFSHRLTAELQHELKQQGQVTVVAPINPFGIKNCFSLTGVVATDNGRIRVTATLIDNESNEIVWADVFTGSQARELITPADVAHEIVTRMSWAGHTAANHGG